MDTSLLIQYILIGLLVLGALYRLYKLFASKFSSKKGKDKPGCESSCCS